MRRVKNVFRILLLTLPLSVSAQTKSEMRDMFYSAEVDILYEDYAEALPKFLNILQIYPENFNVYFRIGQCYINTPGEKEKAISYLETATRHIDQRYREGKFRETDAPLDAYYYLANAYRINNDLDKALNTYNLFLKYADPDIFDTALVNFQIRECYTARELMADPVYVAERNLGKSLNERFSESDPVVSDDENTIVFTRKLQFYDAVFYTKKSNGAWAAPVNMTPQLGVDQDYFSSSLTGDGKTLLLYKTDNYEGNIYVSHFAGDKWSNVEKLNENINTKYWESHATLSRDGNKLYFTSNRKESLGGLDIFVSEKDSTGNWGVPVNLGPVINTQYNEESPFLANNDHTLFFSSRGHKNMGGYDIFRSDLDEKGEWSEPVNLGYPVNTTDDDLFFFPVGDGFRGYYAKFDTSGYGKMDLFIYDIYNDRNPRNFYVTGKATINNLRKEFPERITVTAVNKADATRTASTVSDPETGIYVLRLPQGSYNFRYAADGAADFSKMIEMPLTHRGDTVVIDHVALANIDLAADMSLGSDTAVSAGATGPVIFSLRVEPRSTLKIEAIRGDSVYHSSVRQISDTVFSYSLVPPPGSSKVIFSLTDRFGNNTTAGVKINKAERVLISKPQYERIIAKKQVSTLLEVLKRYATPDVAKVLATLDPEKENISTVDDLVSLVKERAASSGIPAITIDRLALEVALKEGIMTQASADLMFNKSDGAVHDALSGLNMQALKIKNWNDLVAHVESGTSGRVTDADLHALAEYILMDPEPGISTLREKYLYAATFTEDSAFIRDAVAATDTRDLKLQGEWLNALIKLAEEKGVDQTLNRISAAISHKPGTKVPELIRDIIENSDESLRNYLQGLEKIRKTEDLMSRLVIATSDGSVNADVFGRAFAATIIKAKLTNDEIRENMEGRGFNWLWMLWILALACLLYYIWRRIKNKKEN